MCVHYSTLITTVLQLMGRLTSHLGASVCVVALFVILAGCLAGCVDARRPVHARRVPPSAAATSTVSNATPQSNSVFAYPERNQSPDQQARDRYECHEWAVHQSGFDPSLPQPAQPRPTRYERDGPPPGSGVVRGAVTGAVLGTIVSPREPGHGAAAGAVAGAVIGAVSEDAARRRAAARDADANAAANADAAAAAGPQDDYRRAITACLQTRGYRVN